MDVKIDESQQTTSYSGSVIQPQDIKISERKLPNIHENRPRMIHFIQNESKFQTNLPPLQPVDTQLGPHIVDKKLEDIKPDTSIEDGNSKISQNEEKAKNCKFLKWVICTFIFIFLVVIGIVVWQITSFS